MGACRRGAHGRSLPALRWDAAREPAAAKCPRLRLWCRPGSPPVVERSPECLRRRAGHLPAVRRGTLTATDSHANGATRLSVQTYTGAVGLLRPARSTAQLGRTRCRHGGGWAPPASTKILRVLPCYLGEPVLACVACKHRLPQKLLPCRLCNTLWLLPENSCMEFPWLTSWPPCCYRPPETTLSSFVSVFYPFSFGNLSAYVSSFAKACILQKFPKLSSITRLLLHPEAFVPARCSVDAGPLPDARATAVSLAT